MKLIILFLCIELVFGGKCPDQKQISPCRCDQKQDSLSCYPKNTDVLMEKLNVANKNLNDENEKHFARLDVEFELNLFVNYDLNENEFSNLTFDTITLNFTSINQIHKNAFGKTAKTLQILYCSSCAIQNSQPNYDPWAAIGQLSKLKELYLGTNVSEIPEIKPLNGSELKKIQLYNLGQKMTVKSGAFQNLNNLQEIILWHEIEKFEKGAFKFTKKSDKKLVIDILSGKGSTGDMFENGTFDGIQRNRVDILFEVTKLDYLPEGSFKSILDQNKQNKIFIYDEIYKSKIDCSDCRNYWLIRDDKKEQIDRPVCYDNDLHESLFDDNVVTKLKAKCK